MFFKPFEAVNVVRSFRCFSGTYCVLSIVWDARDNSEPETSLLVRSIGSESDREADGDDRAGRGNGDSTQKVWWRLVVAANSQMCFDLLSRLSRRRGLPRGTVPLCPLAPRQSQRCVCWRCCGGDSGAQSGRSSSRNGFSITIPLRGQASLDSL